MKIIRFDVIDQIPASHEDANNPGVVKRVLLKHSQLFGGHVQMINWATLLSGKTFANHYHEDMQEVFIMMGDGATARVEGTDVLLSCGDTLVVDPGEKHTMTNPGPTPIEYIVVGIA